MQIKVWRFLQLNSLLILPIFHKKIVDLYVITPLRSLEKFQLHAFINPLVEKDSSKWPFGRR